MVVIAFAVRERRNNTLAAPKKSVRLDERALAFL